MATAVSDADTTLSALAARLRGQMILPGDPEYDRARAVWNARADRRPRAIVRCAGVSDVIAAVNHARETGMPLSIRSGGHHVGGFAICNGGIVIDLSAMRDVRVDPRVRRARVGPGARVRDLDHEAQTFGLMTTGAPVSTVGIGGYTLGGGLGWTSRAHGLACDNLLSADVVTASGRLVHTSERENPDLFWGLRGGAGNYGVVTSLEFRLHPLGPEVLAGPIVYPMTAAPSVLRVWRDHMLEAPNELQCMPVIFALPPDPGSSRAQGDTVLALFPLWAGDPAYGERAIAPLRAAGRPLSDGVTRAPYATLLAGLDEMFRSGDRNYYRSAFFDALPDVAIDRMLAVADPMPTPFSTAFLEPTGGAIADLAPDHTAFPHRARRFCVTVVPKWERAGDDDAMMTWANRFIDAIAPFSARGVYVNYLDPAAPEPADVAWGAHLDRLADVKRRWDPANLFRHTHNVKPAD